jgi:eukaryotic-like serine/threonine-protein kinase
MVSPVVSQMLDRFAPGTMLGRYELLATIGEGGMARVILARQRGPAGFEKAVVIKVIHPRMSQDQGAIGMLLDEARVAAQINHRNVVQTYELGEAHGTFYIVMEYLHGESLHRMLKAAALGPGMDPRLAGRIVADAAEGLHAAHTLVDLAGRPRSVIHRDVSPGNIVVLFDGTVKVVDFGIAKANDRVSSTTQDGQLKGKYAYMSPEQIRNEPIDHRSDVFSLGIVLWEALTLHRLFYASNVAATLMQILEAPRVAPSTIRPEVGPALDAVALKALAVDARDRFQSAAEMRQALEDAIWESRCSSSDINAYMTAVFAERIHNRRQLLATAQRDVVDERDLTQFLEHSNPNARTPPPLAQRPSQPPPQFQMTQPPRPARPGARRILAAGLMLAGVGLGLGAGLVLIKHVSASTKRPAIEVPVPTAKQDPPPKPGATAPAREQVATAPKQQEIGKPPPQVGTAPIRPELPDPKIESQLRGEHAVLARTDPQRTRTPPTEGPRRPERPEAPAPQPAGGDNEGGATAGELFKKGTELTIAGNFDGAEAAFRQALKVDRRFAPAYRGLGILYQRTGAKDKALDAFKRYLKLAPQASDAPGIQARIEQLGGDP